MSEKISVLDHGYVRLVEAWGHGDAGENHSTDDGPSGLDHDYFAIDHDYECGIIEAARQSTQGSFRDWAPYELCEKCGCWSVLAPGGQYRQYNLRGAPTRDCDHEWKKYPKGDEGLLQFLFNGKPQHATPFEFAGVIIEVQAPIFVFREWHRHRTQSYNEMSARYAPLPNVNYQPSLARCRPPETKNKQQQGISEFDEAGAAQWLAEGEALYQKLEEHYQRGLAVGVPKEVARIRIPVGRYSRMRASANLRNWLGFMTLRSDPGAQLEIRQYAEAVGVILSNCFPRTWSLFNLARSQAQPPTGA